MRLLLCLLSAPAAAQLLRAPGGRRSSGPALAIAAGLLADAPRAADAFGYLIATPAPTSEPTGAPTPDDVITGTIVLRGIAFPVPLELQEILRAGIAVQAGVDETAVTVDFVQVSESAVNRRLDETTLRSPSRRLEDGEATLVLMIYEIRECALDTDACDQATLDARKEAFEEALTPETFTETIQAIAEDLGVDEVAQVTTVSVGTVTPTEVLTMRQKQQCFASGGSCQTCCAECDDESNDVAPFLGDDASAPAVLSSGKCVCLAVGSSGQSLIGTALGDCIKVTGNNNAVFAKGGDDVVVSIGDGNSLSGDEDNDYVYAAGRAGTYATTGNSVAGGTGDDNLENLGLAPSVDGGDGDDYCRIVYDATSFLNCEGVSSPTGAPSSAPTAGPTAPPSSGPTGDPSAAPTAAPSTMAPSTMAPTMLPDGIVPLPKRRTTEETVERRTLFYVDYGQPGSGSGPGAAGRRRLFSAERGCLTAPWAKGECVVKAEDVTAFCWAWAECAGAVCGREEYQIDGEAACVVRAEMDFEATDPDAYALSKEAPPPGPELR